MKMNKKTVKIISVVLLVLMILTAVTTSGLCDGFDSYVPNGDTSTTGSAQRILDNILGWAQVIGIGVAVIMLVVLAIKYISAAPGDKAEIKKHVVIYVLGAVILFAASGILGIIRTFANMIS